MATILAAALAAPSALAHPVRVGRYAEIPFGIAPEHPYPADRGGPRRTGRMRGRVPIGAPARVWAVSPGHRSPRGPTIAGDGTLFFGTTGGLVALGPDGRERWSLRVGPVGDAPSLAPSGALVASTRTGRLVVVSPDGVLLRQIEVRATVRGAPLVLDDGSILLTSRDRRLRRFDADLRLERSVLLPEEPIAAPSRTAAGPLAVGAGSQLVLATLRGEIARRISLGSPLTAEVVVADDGTLWALTRSGAVLALDGRGNVRFRVDLGTRLNGGASAALGPDGALRVPTLAEGVVCIGPGGTERWRHAGASGFTSALSVDEDSTVLGVDHENHLVALEASGAERWRVGLGGFSVEAPIVTEDGLIVVALESGQIQAWRAP
ncbi:MAG: PQQ-binding-like beta-propeller repeat protein [Sandaracinaceae bacterium]